MTVCAVRIAQTLRYLRRNYRFGGQGTSGNTRVYTVRIAQTLRYLRRNYRFGGQGTSGNTRVYTVRIAQTLRYLRRNYRFGGQGTSGNARVCAVQGSANFSVANPSVAPKLSFQQLCKSLHCEDSAHSL